MIAKTILGTMILEGLNVAKDYIPMLKEEYFDKICDREIFKIIAKKVEQNEDFDSNIIASELKTLKPYTYLVKLVNQATSTYLLPNYIEKLKKEFLRNEIPKLLKKDDSLEEVAEIIQKVEGESLKEKAVRIDDVTKSINKMLDEKTGVEFQFEFYPLKKIAVGIDRGMLTVIGGYTGQAKSSLAIQLADDFASNGHKVLFCTSEMTEAEIGRRMIARRCHIDSMKFKTLSFDEEEIEKKNHMILTVAKSRDGKIGFKEVAFQPEFYEFADMFEEF